MKSNGNVKKFRKILLLIAIPILAILGVALAAELNLVEVVAGTDNSVIVVQQGQTVNFTVKISASGKIRNDMTQENPSKARIHTKYSVVGNTGSSDTWSDWVNFWSKGVASDKDDVVWTGFATPYLISATASADVDATLGDYTIRISSETTNPIENPPGHTLRDETADYLTIRVVAGPGQPPPTDTTEPETWIATGPNEWVNTTNVDFTWTGSDNVTPTANLLYSWRLNSGSWSVFSAATSVTLTGLTEGHHNFEVSAMDEADNIDSTPALHNFGVDLTLPVITAGTPNGTSGSNGWWVSNVTVPFSATDNLSGFPTDGALTINLASKTTVGEGSAVTVTSDSISDRAGNTAAGIQAGPFKIDWTAPGLSWGAVSPTPNANNWNNSVPVNIPVVVTDATSGPASTNPTQVSFNSEGQNQTQTVTVYDNAGNSTTSTSPAVNIDLTPPVVVITLPAPMTVLLNQVGISATASWSATDNLSGIDGAASGTITKSLVTSAPVGARTVDFTAALGTALDNAGNQSAAVTKTYTYYIHYAFGGISPPVNADGSSVFKLNSTIPIKFQLTDAAGNFVTNAVAKLYLTKIANGVSGTDIEAISTAAATTGNLFRYDLTDNQYIFNLATKTLSIGTWQLKIELDDGTTKIVNISLRK